MHVWYALHTHSTSYTCRNLSMHGARKKNTNKIGLWRCHSRCHFTRLLFFQQLKRKIESHALTPVPNKTCKFVVEKYRPNLLNIVKFVTSHHFVFKNKCQRFKMSSVPTSENNHSDAPTDRAKRARVIQNTRNGTGSNVSNQASEDGKLTENVQTNKSPSDIAKGVASEFIAKLHPGLRALLTNHVEPVITKHASAFWKERNYREMCRDPEYIPATCMVELPLHAVAEVRQSEGYTALNARKDATLWDCALALKPYVLSVQDMNRMALKTRAEEAFYRCLHGAATGFIAQRNVERYTPHQAVMDAFASNANDIMNVVKLSLKSVLRGYKKEHSLDRLPTPTTTFDFGQTLGEVNGPSPAANQGASRTGGEDAVAMEEETADTPRGRLANSAAAIL